MEECVLYEQAPYFGHAPLEIREGDFQVGSINVDNLTKYKGSEKDERIFRAMLQYQLQVVAMQET